MASDLDTVGAPKPDASIIVIAYNEQGRIRECLAALSRQDAQVSYEVIVVDDGSTDQTAAEVEEARQGDPRIRLIRHESNHGRGAARLTGQNSTGAAIVGFVDADIDVPTNWVQSCVDALTTYSAVSGIATPDGDCAVIWRMFQAPVRVRRGPVAITGSNVMFRREALAIEPFQSDYRLGEDFRQAQRMLMRGLSLGTLMELKVVHREKRSYAGAHRWMWQLGVDAASHPFEFRIIRVPDVTWLVWFLSSIGTIILAALGVWPWWTPLAVIAATTALIDTAYIYTRFHLWPHPQRWIVSVVANGPLMFLYLLGRTWGLLRLAGPPRGVSPRDPLDARCETSRSPRSR